MKPGRAVIPATDHRFEGDLKEKGLKRHPCGPSGLPPGRFEGDLKEKGLKRHYAAVSGADGRFEGDLKEKGLKPRLLGQAPHPHRF